MNKNLSKIVTRFAPSPTGYMHIGGVRTALYAWAFARKHNGIFILRIEDTDKEREIPGSIDHIIETLKWLGITWDEGPDIGGSHAPYLQSQRLESYKKYAKILIDKNLAYADPYTEQELEKFRKKAENEKKPFLYREHRPKNPPNWDGHMPLRLKITNIVVSEWQDEVRGSLKAGPEALDDFILIKSDGYPTYNFAHIVDDLEMGVTHIMRADEFISSTPKFIALYEALGVKMPYIATLPPIMAPDGKKKLGKRDGAKDVLEYREDGYLPSAMINFLVYIGWSPEDNREILTPQEFIRIFDLSRIHHSGGGFNIEKLDWINREHLKLLSYEEQEEYVVKFIPNSIKQLSEYNNTIIHNLTPIIIERISKGSDIKKMAENGELTYFFGKPAYDRDSLFFKSSKIQQENKYKILSEYLTQVLSLISKIPITNFTKNKIKETLWSYAEKIGRGDILWPMRYALSGQDKSPDPFALAEILGKEETVSRLNSAILLLKKQ